MFNYLSRKVISIFITLLLVSMLCFLMIKLSPGDKADALLRLQGISLTGGSTGYFEEYEILSHRLGLDLPWFYFSVRSSHIPNHFPSHWNFIQKNTALRLLHGKLKQSDVFNYIESIVNLQKICNDQQNTACQREVSFIFPLDDPPKILQRINRLRTLNSASNDIILNLALDNLEDQAQKLNQKISFYYPMISFHGLDNQYHHWLKKILSLDFGVSVVDGQQVTGKIWQSLKWTLVITLLAFMISLGLGIPLGILAARKLGSFTENIIEVVMNIFYAIPVFWLATLLIVFFTTPEYGLWTDIFPGPSFGVVSSDEGVFSLIIRNLGMMILPILCLTLSALPVIVRLTKRSVLSESVRPYVNALRAKGLKNRAIYYRHIVPNALIPIVTLVSNSLPVALAGSLIVEVIFNIPGMGRLMYNSLFAYDWDVCFGILLLISVVTSLVLLASDIIYSRLDPKIRIS